MLRRLRWALVKALQVRLLPIAARRPPDVVIGANDPNGAYLRRWHLIRRNRWFNIYLHNFLRSDDDRALHDHPWVNVSIILRGSYYEETIAAGGIRRRTVRAFGDIALRWPWHAHRIQLPFTPEEMARHDWFDVWTLFITGPNVRTWGFHCPEQGWVPWQRFTAAGSPGDVGPGCEG